TLAGVRQSGRERDWRSAWGANETAWMRILVVEDDPRISEVLEYALKADGYDVQTAQRGREAAEMARKSSPGLIVLDVGLPDIDGFEVCRLVRTFSDV